MAEFVMKKLVGDRGPVIQQKPDAPDMEAGAGA